MVISIRILITLVCIAGVTLIGILALDHKENRTRLMPLGVDQIVESKSLIGLTESEVIQQVGKPSRHHGPMSTLTLSDRPQWYSPDVIFNFDLDLRTSSIVLGPEFFEREHGIKLQFSLESFNRLLPSEQRSMLHRLASEKPLPLFLDTQKGVASAFPSAAWKKHWIYDGGAGEPDLVIAFNEIGVAIDCFIDM